MDTTCTPRCPLPPPRQSGTTRATSPPPQPMRLRKGKQATTGAESGTRNRAPMVLTMVSMNLQVSCLILCNLTWFQWHLQTTSPLWSIQLLRTLLLITRQLTPLPLLTSPSLASPKKIFNHLVYKQGKSFSIFLLQNRFLDSFFHCSNV